MIHHFTPSDIFMFKKVFAYLRLKKLLKQYSTSFPYVPEKHVFVYENKGSFSKLIEAGEKLPMTGDLRAVFDLRECTHTVPSLKSLTKDGVDVSYKIVFVKKVTNPIKAAYAVSNIEESLAQLIKSTIEDSIAKFSSIELMLERINLSDEATQLINSRIEDWGVEVRALSISELLLPARFQEIVAQRAKLTSIIDLIATRKVVEANTNASLTNQRSNIIANSIATLASVTEKHPSAVSILHSLIEIEKARTLYQIQRNTSSANTEACDPQSSDKTLLALMNAPLNTIIQQLSDLKDKNPNIDPIYITKELAIALDIMSGKIDADSVIENENEPFDVEISLEEESSTPKE